MDAVHLIDLTAWIYIFEISTCEYKIFSILAEDFSFDIVILLTELHNILMVTPEIISFSL